MRWLGAVLMHAHPKLGMTHSTDGATFFIAVRAGSLIFLPAVLPVIK